MFGYIVRETDAAYAFILPPLSMGMKPLWVPKSCAKKTELDSVSVSIDIVGEPMRRMGTPVMLDIAPEFLAKPAIAKALNLIEA